jgi:predicted component of type VI protein secretion system
MSFEPNGELIPEGGGDNIPLIRDTLTIGRRESCDICMRFPNVSSLHCQLTFEEGRWWIRDLGSLNGIKVNGKKELNKKILSPGDRLTIAKKHYCIQYQIPVGTRAMEQILEDMEEEDILSQPLLERAGLIKPGQNGSSRARNPLNFDASKFSIPADDSE